MDKIPPRYSNVLKNISKTDSDIVDQMQKENRPPIDYLLFIKDTVTPALLSAATRLNMDEERSTVIIKAIFAYNRKVSGTESQPPISFHQLEKTGTPVSYLISILKIDSATNNKISDFLNDSTIAPFSQELITDFAKEVYGANIAS